MAGSDLFYVRPLAHSFKTRYAFTCEYCKEDSDSPNRRALSCVKPECREKSRKANASKQARKRWNRALATRRLTP